MVLAKLTAAPLPKVLLLVVSTSAAEASVIGPPPKLTALALVRMVLASVVEVAVGTFRPP